MLTQARKSIKEMPTNSNRAGSEELGAEEPPQFSANGRPMRKSAGKRLSNPEFVNSTEVIQDAMGDMKEDNRALLTSGRRTKATKRKRARSPSPAIAALSPVQCVTESDFTTQETTPAPVEVTEATGGGPINLTFNIPLGFVGPLKVQLDPSILNQLGHFQPTRSSTQAISTEKLPKANDFKRLKLTEESQKPQAPKSKKLTKWIKKYGAPPRGFLDLPAGKTHVFPFQSCF
jgi:hypothetical protein